MELHKPNSRLRENGHIRRCKSRVELTAEYPQELTIEYVADRIGLTVEDMQPAVGAAVLKDGNLVAAAVFNNFHVLTNGSWCEISVVIGDKTILSRRILRQAFEYPFRQLGVTRLKAECSALNRECRKLLDRLGFKQEGISRRAHDGSTDSVMWSMLPEECFWIGGD